MGFRQIGAYLRRRWRKSNKKTDGDVEIRKPEQALSIGPSSDSSSSSVCVDVIDPVAPRPLLYQLRSKDEEKFNCQFRIPAGDVKYSMVTTVTKSWDQDLKTIPNWDRIGGEILLRKMFELEPDCIRMFGFPEDTKHDDPALSENDKFIKKGIALIIAVDVALTFLGPDLEPLEDQLVELGGRHVARQCHPRHWPMVGVALFHTLDAALGAKFTEEIQHCWIVLYNFLGYHMIRGLIKNGGPTWETEQTVSTSTSPEASTSSVSAEVIVPETPTTLLYPLRSKDEEKFNCQFRIPASDVKYSMVLTVTKSWDQDLKTIPNWDRIGGEILLRKMFELEPDCIRMFGFPEDTKFDDPALSENDKFMKKGIALIIAVDVALTFLGPDLEPLEDQLVELGGRHVARQCHPRHWPMVGVALFHTLDAALGAKFTEEIKHCWIVLYNFLGYHMIRGLIKNGGPTWED